MQVNQQQHLEYGNAEEYLGIIRRVLVKRWWLIALFALGAGIAGLAASVLVEPVYRAMTTIRIQKNVLAPPTRRGNGAFGPGVLETEALWLKNRSLLTEVMDKTGVAATARAEKERIAVMEKLRDSIEITALADSLQVAVDWNEAELAARIANTLADSFIEKYGAVNRAEARELRSLLERQASIVQLKVNEAQRTFSEFVKTHGDIAVSRRGQASNEQLVQLQTEMERNRIALANGSTRLELVKKQMDKGGKALSDLEFNVTAEQITNSAQIQTLRANVSQLQQQVAILGSLYTDEYPDLRTAKAQLREARQALADEFTKLVPGLVISVDDGTQIDLITEFLQIRSEIARLTDRQRELSALVARLEETTRELPDKEAQYFTLLRNKTINEDLYNTLLTRLTEAGIAEQTDTWEVRVLERAYVPHTRLRPKPVKNAAFGAIVGLLLGVAVCMLLEYLDDSFKTADEVEKYLQLPVLAVLPKLDEPALEYGPKKYH